MTSITPTIYPELNAILADLVHSAQAILDGNFAAAYLQGSLAGSHPDPHGDVDFLIVTRRVLSAAEASALEAMHRRIFDQDIRWAKHLEGSYIPADALRRYSAASEPPYYLDNGSRELIRDKHDDSLVVRWVLLDHGITLAGPDPGTLIEPVSADDLRREVVTTMQRFADVIFADPAAMNNRWYQPYATLSFCRMLQTLQSGRVESKYSAAQWAMQTLEPRWEGLIQRAWDERPNQYTKIRQGADPDDFNLTLEFIRYALDARDRFLPPRES